MNPNIQGSLKRNWMKFVLGVNIPPQIFHRLFDKEAGVKFGFQVSSLFCFQKGASMYECYFYRGARNECITTDIFLPSAMI
jgi:hypothetical protein